MVETARDRVLAAVCDILYITESDLTDGDATDLRDLGLDSVRFVLLMKRLGVSPESVLRNQMADSLSIGGWTRELEKAGESV